MSDYVIGKAYHIKTDKRCRGETISDRLIQDGIDGIFRGYENGRARFHVCYENDFHQDIGMTFEFPPEYIDEWELKITPLVGQRVSDKEQKQVRIVDSQFCNIVSQAVKSATLKYPKMLYELWMVPKYKNDSIEFDASLVDFRYEFDADSILSNGIRVTYKGKSFTVTWTYNERRQIYFHHPDTDVCLSILLIEENKLGCLAESVGTARYPELRPLALEICNSFNEYATGLKELEQPFYTHR